MIITEKLLLLLGFDSRCLVQAAAHFFTVPIQYIAAALEWLTMAHVWYRYCHKLILRASPLHTPKLSAMWPYGGRFGRRPRLLSAIFSCAYTAICHRQYANRNLVKDTHVKILFELCSIMVQKPKEEKGNQWRSTGRQLHLLAENAGHHKNNREEQEYCGIHVLNDSNSNIDILFTPVGRSRGVALGSLKVHLIWLNSQKELLVTSQHPGCRTNSRCLKKKTEADDHINQRVAQESQWKG